MDLTGFFTPRTIAVVGATDREHAPGGRVLRYLRAHGFTGTILPVNPNRDQVAGMRAYPSREQLPERPDLTIAAIPIAQVIDYLDDATARGDRDFVIFSAAMQPERDALAQRIEQFDLRVLGPNCVGFFNVTDGVPAGFSSAAEVPLLPRGGLAILGQSGGVISGLLNRTVDRAIGLSTVVATGDEVGMRTHDVLRALASDPATETALLYVESFRDGDEFVAAAREFVDAGRRLIVLRGGVSPSGREAATTHTGGLSSDETISAAVLQEVGAIQADSLSMALDIAEVSASPAFAALTAVPRIGIVGGSGGGSVLLTDAAHRAGVPLGVLSPDVVQTLEGILPDFASAVNPLDVTAGVLERPEVLSAAAKLLAEDPGIDAVVTVGLATSATTASGVTQGALSVHELDMPALIARETGSLSFATMGSARELGIPVIDGFDAAMIAVARLTGRPRPLQLTTALAAVAPDGRWSGPLGELESLELIASLGARVPAITELDAGQLPEQYPVVVKVSASSVFHKREHGLIAVGITNEEELSSAHERLTERAKLAGIDHACVFAQAMVQPGTELFVGLKTDPGFGPMVLVGLGGSLIERIGIVQIARASAAANDPIRLIDALDLPDGLLAGGLAGLTQLVGSLAAFALGEGANLHEADVNPVIVNDEGYWAVDAKLVFGEDPNG